MQQHQPLVSIICDVYNQELYIKECLEGFLLQKATFPIEILVHDDASTDNTAAVIRKYESRFPNLIKPIYQQENQYSKKNSIWKKFQLPRVQGKYIALCEGDDYWIDPLKLQKQVDFLEANPDYGMCHTGFQRLYQASHKIEHNNKSLLKRNGEFKDLLNNGNYICTATTLFRKEAFQQYLKEIQPETKHWLMGDYPMWLWFAKNSKIHFIPDETSVYRILNNSASHSSDYHKRVAFIQSTYDIQSFFGEKYNEQVLPHLKNLADYTKKFHLAKKDPNQENILLLKDSLNQIQKNKFKISRIFLKFLLEIPILFKAIRFFQK